MDWGYLVPVVVLHLLPECLQVGVVLQSECLVGNLVLVVPQLEHLLVGWALEVVQLVSHGADLGDEVEDLLLNLLSLSLLLQAALPNFFWVLLPLPEPLPFTCVLCADLVLGFTALGATDMHEGKCNDLDLVLGLPALDVDAMWAYLP